MPSHLSTIGFVVETEDDFARLAERVSRDASSIEVKEGRYLRWTSDGGAELWLQVNSRKELVGMNPHFAGQSRVRVGVVARVAHPNSTQLDGAFHAWASPSDDAPGEGDYPFVFDLPDAGVYADLDIPGVAEAQIAAFAHEIAFFDSEDAYDASQDPEDIRFASKSFIPSGMFQAEGSDDQPPMAQAIFTGEVVKAAVCENPICDKRFYWALVDTLGGCYDVVIDPVLLDREPAVGGILSGSFWLSGRLVSYPKKKKSWFGQILGGAG